MVREAPPAVTLSATSRRRCLATAKSQRADDDLDSLRFEQPARQVGDVVVLARDQSLGVFDHRHARAEAAKHLGELEPDVAAAGDDQMLGQDVERQDRRVVERADLGEPRPVGHDGARADVEEDLRRRQPLAVDLIVCRLDRSGPAPRTSVRLAVSSIQARQAGARLARPRPCAPSPRFMSMVTGPTRDAVFGRAARHMRNLGAGDQRLRRRAAVVDAGAAEMCALDQRDLPSGLGQLDRRETGRTGRRR